MFQQILNEKRSKILDLPDLPPFQAVAQQIIAQVTGENVDIPRLSRTIEQDPAVFSRIIGVANSAYFGCPDKIYTVSHAIVRVLGLCMVKSLALGIVLNRPFNSAACPGFSMERYWFNSLLTATVAQRLGRYIKFGQQDFQEHAYLAGMLHNVGELILAHLFPSEMNDVYTQLQLDPDQNILDLQSEIVGINNYEAGAILARRWHLPNDLQTVFSHYHEQDYDGEHWQLLHLVRLSNLLITNEDDTAILTHKDVRYSLDKLGLTEGQVSKLQQKLLNDRQDVENLAEILSQA